MLHPATRHPPLPEEEPTHIPLEQYEALRRDFVEFTYIVSHDFQAPLRHIRGFSKLLLTQRPAQTNEKEQRYVHIVNESINRCEAMMTGLLEYSRLNTRGNPFTVADGNILVEQAVAELRKNSQMQQANIRLEHLPSLFGDAEQLKKMFACLIDNAIKFRHEGRTPEVRVYAVPVEEGCELCVEDNGIGLAPEYESQVYTLFRKIDPSTPGVGVGLTLCRKIVAKHHGQITYLPNDKGGTTFSIFLPQQER